MITRHLPHKVSECGTVNSALSPLLSLVLFILVSLVTVTGQGSFPDISSWSIAEASKVYPQSLYVNTESIQTVYSFYGENFENIYQNYKYIFCLSYKILLLEPDPTDRAEDAEITCAPGNSLWHWL